MFLLFCNVLNALLLCRIIYKMDALNSHTEHLFSLPVALIFQNESSGDEWSDFGYDATSTATVNETQSGPSWKKEVALNGFQKLEKVGDVIRRDLKWALILHAYGFGCLFFILAFYTFISILNIRSFISSRPFMTTINGFLCLLGASRGASLFIDAYSLKENMPKLFGQVLWDLGFPSIISAFCLMQLAFLQFTQFQVGPEGLRKKSCLSLMVTAHFLLTIGMDIVAASHESLMLVKHMVHYIFLMWGVILCSNFLYTGYKVMSLIRKIPGELSDPSYKGIMQLAILEPQNKLPGSMAAAVLPTLCAPKIHQQDSNTLSAVGFRSEGSSRILESESIPMLEEMTGSSGDEITPKGRRSSFQNQGRNQQKLLLIPKISFESTSNLSKDEENTQGRRLSSGMKFPKTVSPKNPVKAEEFDFNFKPNHKITKHRERFIHAKGVQEFKNKTERKTYIENENFHFSDENKYKSNFNSTPEPKISGLDNLLPEILVIKSDNCLNGGFVKTMEKEEVGVGNEKNKKILHKLMNEISRDLNEMQILREEKPSKADEVVEIHKSKKNKFEIEPKNGLKKKTEVEKDVDCRKKIMTGRKESLFYEKEYRSNIGRKHCERFKFEKSVVTQETVNLCPCLMEATNFEETKVDQKKFRIKRKKKSLTYKMKAEDEEEEENATQECLFLQQNSTDMTLKSALKHISYENKEALGKADNEEELEKVRRSKAEWVLNITYITAMWGLMLCLSNIGKIYNPFGVPDIPRNVLFLNSTYLQSRTPIEENVNRILLSSWPWLWFQTFCRALELAMGCAMANITRQPAANHRYSRALSFRNRDLFYNI